MLEIISPLKNVKARKDHQCDWCGFDIKQGEIYQTTFLKSDYAYTWKNHIKCMELVCGLKMEGYDGEGITENDFYEYITEEFKQIWIEIDNALYESKDFIIPPFKDQIDFVYKHRVQKSEKEL